MKLSPDMLTPEVRKTISSLPRLPFDKRPLIPLARLIYDLVSRSRPRTADVEIITERNGQQEIRILKPKKKRTQGAVIWLYGGGHLAGKPSHLDALGSRIAAHLGVTFIAPGYRLAPKHPFPADLDDAYAAWSWVLENASHFELDTDRLAIGGNSAGAGLAAALVQRIHDQGGTQPVSQVLFYPMLDDRTAANRALDGVEHFIWNNKANHTAWAAYLAPHKPGAASLPPYAAPARRSNLEGLPPAWIGCCDLDLFYDEDRAYADGLKESGVDCEVYVATGVPHAFEALCPEEDIAKSFIQSALDFLAARIL